MSQTDPATESRVRYLLELAGLHPSEEELAVLVSHYPMLRDGAETLHGMVDARYESPALIFDPLPVFAEWDGAGPA